MAVGFECVGEGKGAKRVAVYGDGDDAGDRPDVAQVFRERQAAVVGFADADGANAGDVRADARAAVGFGVGGLRDGNAARGGGSNDGAGERVGGVLFDGGGEAVEFVGFF